MNNDISSYVILSIHAQSVGPYGDHFTFGWSLSSIKSGFEIAHGYEACPFDTALSFTKDKEEINQNLPTNITVANPTELYDKFWKTWMLIKQTYPNVLVVVDCGQPVESNLFNRCVELDVKNRRLDAPHSLHEVNTILFAADIKREDLITNPNDLLEYHPLNNARFSGHLFYQGLKKIRKL